MTHPTCSATDFQITVQPSGLSFSAAAGETLLEAALRAGVDLPYGCQDGACGSCKCKLLAGSVSLDWHEDKALSAAEEASGFVLTCCGVARSDVVLENRQVSLVKALPVKKMPARVVLLEKKSPDVMLLRLQVPPNEGFVYHPGQYLELILRDRTQRSYSIANAPQVLHAPMVSKPELELHIRHQPGGKFSDQVFTTMKEKDILRMEGPFGSCYLRADSTKPIVLLAAGTGFAPIKAMLEHLQYIGSPRATTLFWGVRRPHDLYLDEWVKARLTEMPNLRYVPVVSDALPGDAWSGRTGFVHQAVLDDLPDLSGHQVYACGAPIVVESARSAYAQAGLPGDEFFADSFTPTADAAPSQSR